MTSPLHHPLKHIPGDPPPPSPLSNTMVVAGTSQAFNSLEWTEGQGQQNHQKSFKDTLNHVEIFKGNTPSAWAPPSGYDEVLEAFIPISKGEYRDLCYPCSISIIFKACGNSFSTDYFAKSIGKFWKLPSPCPTSPHGMIFLFASFHSKQNWIELSLQAPGS